MAGAGTKVKFFDFDWKTQSWNLVFLVGAVIGGWIAKQYLNDGAALDLSQSTIDVLSKLGFSKPEGMQPLELYSWESVASIKGFLILAIGGFMVGFGSRYAGGCTSGHAISGLSDLQVPSLVAVVGFFAGGLAMTYFIFPLIF